MRYTGITCRSPRQLSLESIDDTLEPIRHAVIVPVSGIHRGVVAALRYARSIAPGNVQAVYVDTDEEATIKLCEAWERMNFDIPLRGSAVSIS